MHPDDAGIEAASEAVFVVQVSRMGVPHENTSGQCTQLITCSTDQ